MLVAGQPQRAGLLNHRAEKLPRHVVLKQPRAVARKARVVEARLVPVHIQEPAEQKIVVQLLAQQPLAAYCVKRHQERGFQQALRRDRGPADLTVRLLEQRREFLERHFRQRLNPPERMVARHPLLRIYQRQHRRLWPIVSPHPPLPPQTRWPPFTLPFYADLSIQSRRDFSTPC